jgi:two-component system response regulator HydG
MLRELIIDNLPSTAGENHEEDVSRYSRGGKVEDMERDLIRNTLESVGGNRREAAKILGIGERTLYRKLKKFDLT